VKNTLAIDIQYKDHITTFLSRNCLLLISIISPVMYITFQDKVIGLGVTYKKADL